MAERYVAPSAVVGVLDVGRMDWPLHGRRAPMMRPCSIQGEDLVAALLVGGFTVTRRERGLALLVRNVDAVVVPERRMLDAAHVAGILARAAVSAEQLDSWLAATTASATRPAFALASGFHRRAVAPEPRTPRTVDEVVEAARKATAKATAAHEGANAVLADSRLALEQHRPAEPPDEQRVRAIAEALERWQQALRERGERDRRERR